MTPQKVAMLIGAAMSLAFVSLSAQDQKPAAAPSPPAPVEPDRASTALLKAKSALRWRRPTSETNKMVRSGENLAPTFMNDFPQPGALPIVLNGQVIGAMGVSSGDGERCAQAAIDLVFKGQATTVGR